MYHRGNDLTKAKTLELQRALTAAGPEILEGGFTLQTTAHPLTKKPGYTISMLTPKTSNANLIIVQQKDTGVVQFRFPDRTMRPSSSVPGETSIHNFAFISPLQLGMPLGDATKWVIRAILKVPEEIASDAVCVAARVVEKLNKTEGFIYLAKGYQQTATGYELEQAKDKRVLLFVHGIFSSIHGAFGDLGDPAATDTTMKKLIDAYSGHVFGYDHWTISKTPLQNALDLLDAIPDQANWDIDVICHSRGGLVVRSLLSVIAEGVEPTNDGLRLVAQRRAGKIKSIDKTFFVAAANQGSPLANPDEIQNFLNIAAFLASKTDCFALDVVVGLTRVLVSAAFNLPGVQELSTTSTLVKDLNQIGTLMADGNIYGARADFDCAQSILLEGGVLLDRLLMRVDSDLVVPYAGVASPHPDIPADHHLLSFGSPEAKQGKVWHTEFFSQPETHKLLIDQLAGT